MLTDKHLKTLKGGEKVYKVADQQGLYAAVLRSGTISFRYDYRLNGRRETLVVGQYDPELGAKYQRELHELEFGMSLSLSEARLLLPESHYSGRVAFDRRKRPVLLACMQNDGDILGLSDPMPLTTDADGYLIVESEQ